MITNTRPGPVGSTRTTSSGMTCTVVSRTEWERPAPPAPNGSTRGGTDYGVTVIELKSAGRAARLSWPRQVAIHLARELTGASLHTIGEAFGGRNHATVLHACKRVEERVGSDQHAVHELEELATTLSGNQ